MGELVPASPLVAFENEAKAQLALCKCGLAPKVGYSAHLTRFGRANLGRIRAIVISCACGRYFEEAFDFDDTMNGITPEVFLEKAPQALWHWNMIQKHDLPLNAPAALDRRIVAAEERLRLEQVSVISPPA